MFDLRDLDTPIRGRARITDPWTGQIILEVTEWQDPELQEALKTAGVDGASVMIGAELARDREAQAAARGRRRGKGGKVEVDDEALDRKLGQRFMGALDRERRARVIAKFFTVVAWPPSWYGSDVTDAYGDKVRALTEAPEDSSGAEIRWPIAVRRDPDGRVVKKIFDPDPGALEPGDDLVPFGGSSVDACLFAWILNSMQDPTLFDGSTSATVTPGVEQQSRDLDPGSSGTSDAGDPSTTT